MGTKTSKRGRLRLTAVLLLGIAALATLGCSSNRRVSVGGSVGFSSSGSWGHSLSVGIHSHGRRR